MTAIGQADHPQGFVDVERVATDFGRDRDVLAGEPEGIFTFLGSGRLAEPLLHHRPDLALHGHAHAGTLQGSVAGLVPVYNVAVPVMKQDFWFFELTGTQPEVPAHVEVQAGR